MSDGKTSHAGIMRTSMEALKDLLQNDATLIENQVKVIYALDHPSKQTVGAIPKFTLKLQPASFVQLTSAGALDLQYYSWITIKYKPATHGVDEEDELSYLCEYLTDLLHRKVYGGMSTFVNRVMINFETFKMVLTHREIELKLAHDEIGAIIAIWQSPKSIEKVEEDEDEGKSE